MHSEQTKSSCRSGLTRSETLWVVVLISGIVLLIVSTLRSEVERGHQRMAEDMLSHLASQLYLGMEAQDLHDYGALDLPRIGPGNIPERLQIGGRAPQALQDLMPANSYLPDDPWGYGYVLVEGLADDRKALFLVSAGPEGELPVTPTLGSELSQRVHLPPAE
ncbi:MAG: hypothetical protein GY747_00535 [Planctomycetes bacterium]|nr:hypothetical protein [Planctomycetota bacterium]MCP4770796.1 hypothetical protein [Planctomycetota bacterium]MCP4861336.1 hypothetical protein [Planctomycetota bacterium]